jgi:hypothetical protein
MLKLKFMIRLALLLLLQCAAMWAQQANSITSLVSDLKSPDEERRFHAYKVIKADRDALKRTDVRAALLDLLDRENQRTHKEQADRGEGNAEDIAELSDTVTEFADWHDQRQVCILANTPYNPDSEFARGLAVKGGAVVAPCLLKIAQHKYGDVAVTVLVQISAVTKELSPAIRQQIRQATLAGLRDADRRLVTVQALDKFGTPDLIPVLQEIARSDPYSRLLDNGQRRFDIREAATKAIQSIQARANSQ